MVPSPPPLLTMQGGSMVDSDRLNVPAIDTFSHWFECARCSSHQSVPFLVGVLHYCMYTDMYISYCR